MTLLEQLRLDARLTRDQLAKKADVPVRTIRALESGDVRSPRDETLIALADVLLVQPSALARDFERGVPA